MSQSGTAVNRKWIKKRYMEASCLGQYFEGCTSFDIAVDMVRKLDMDYEFIGKLDDMVGMLVKEGSYAIVDKRLVRSDNVVLKMTEAGRRHVRRQTRRRYAKLTRRRECVLLSEWHSEATA